MKLKLGLETVRQDVALMEAARKAAGDEFKLMCDGNKAGPYGPISWPRYPWSFTRAVETARGLAPLSLTWLEEPLPRFDYDQFAATQQDAPACRSRAPRTMWACTRS